MVVGAYPSLAQRACVQVLIPACAEPPYGAHDEGGTVPPRSAPAGHGA